jgi:hypothetical protein
MHNFLARRVAKEDKLATVFEQALAGWRRNNPNDAPTHVFASAGLSPADVLDLKVCARNNDLTVELRRDVQPYDIGVGVHLPTTTPFAVEGQGDSDV